MLSAYTALFIFCYISLKHELYVGVLVVSDLHTTPRTILFDAMGNVNVATTSRLKHSTSSNFHIALAQQPVRVEIDTSKR